MVESVKKALSKMTLADKAALVCGATAFSTAEFPKLEIRKLQFLDGGTGINFEQLFSDFLSQNNTNVSFESVTGNNKLNNVIKNFYSPENLSEEEIELYNWIIEKLEEKVKLPGMSPGCFPPGILLGATFNPKITEQIGDALGAEAVVFGVDVLLGTPNVNIHRDPLGGRVFEGHSEDPYLVSVMAPPLVRGVQKHPVAANVKHFAANNQETNRMGINELISRRALEEIYLPGFRACVEDGKVMTLMSAYNKINGVPCTENTFLLNEKLRKKWKFDGIVVSDWGAVRNQFNALAAGNDLNMPGPVNSDEIVNAVKEEIFSSDILTQSAERIVNLIKNLDEKKTKYIAPASSAEELKKYTDLAAYKAAAEGIVLLKNENDIFPIDLNDKSEIIITGTGCDNFLACGTGSAGVITDRNTSFTEELAKLTGNERISIQQNVLKIKGKGETVLVVASLSGMEGNDRNDMKLDKKDRAVIRELILGKQNNKNFKLGIILNVCGPVTLSDFEPYTDGIICTFLPGMQGGKALADIVTGIVNPSGKLPLTFPVHYRDTPTHINFPGDGHEVVYGEGIYVGYRYYDKKKIKPAYAFGYGLSYTNFEIFDVEFSSERFSENLSIKGKIRNTGDRYGAQVVQIYISDVYSSCPKPIKELKRFQKIFLDPGEEKYFEFRLTEEDFSYYDTDYNRFVCEEGFFDIHVATSSLTEDCMIIKRVYKTGTSPYSYGLNSTVKVFFEHAELHELLIKFWNQEGFDIGVLLNTYQYNPDKKLYEIIPKIVDSDTEINQRLEKFLEEVSKTEKR